MSFKIWGIECNESISDKDKIYLLNLPKDLPSMQWVCDEIDRIWDSLELNNKKPLLEQDIGSYYSHPVWIMNGLFSEADPLSKRHHIDIIKFIDENNIKKIADYGGGSGVFAFFLVSQNSSIEVDIVRFGYHQYHPTAWFQLVSCHVLRCRTNELNPQFHPH